MRKILRRLFGFFSSEINLGAIFILGIFIFLLSQRLGTGVAFYNDGVVLSSLDMATNSRFSEEIVTKTTTIPLKTVYENDDSLLVGEQKVKQGGEEGRTEIDYKTLYYDGKFYDEEVVDTRMVAPKDKIVLRGTKEVLKTINTEAGTLTSYGSLRVWATSYDKNCLGCDEWTATGRRLQKGIIAVDPRVIPLHTKLYVPGYGVGYAEDVGGGVKGNKIDLGFEDVRNGGWSARWVEIYLIK